MATPRTFTEEQRQELIGFLVRVATACRAAATETDGFIAELRTLPLDKLIQVAEKFERTLNSVVEQLAIS